MATQILVTLHSGTTFDLLNPKVEDINIEDIARSLAKQCRFNGHTNDFYSVARHSIIMAENVPEELAVQALLHDATEAYVGDMIKPLKQYIPFFNDIEAVLWSVIAKRFNLPEDLHDTIKYFDRVMLATETRDLLPNHVNELEFTEGAEPLAYHISTIHDCNDWHGDYVEFLGLFNDLTYNEFDDKLNKNVSLESIEQGML